MAGRGRGNPGPGGRELNKRGSGSDLGSRRGDRRDTAAKSSAADKSNTAASAEKPQPKQVKEAVQESKPEQTAASVQVRRMRLQCSAKRIRKWEKPFLLLNQCGTFIFDI